VTAATATRLRLRVGPAARRAAVVGRHGDGWKVRVTAAPEHGAANAELVRLLAAALEVPRGAVTLVSGRSSRDKIVELAGIEPGSVERRLEAAAKRSGEEGRV